ncbi:MAG: gliding motility-associated C-terminal domain-containing protein [Bacteroidetes bacterium]|nr:gliding motility-associated C-terminal domain-containing protein [Bacteroidota bacterium]
MKKFLFVSCLLIVLPVYASHIVGGEFEMIHLSGYTYQFNMILYFDDINGNPGAQDTNVTVSFYRKKDNIFITSLILPLLSRSSVSYTQPACSSEFLQTDRLFYSANIVLSPDTFNDPAGYYASWQRCCRNYNITNIYSEDPNSSGRLAAGQTFYIEFPPVVKDGQPFVNSSPHLFPPLSDYACPGRPYYVNFAGTDDDGDSIAYSLTTPLNTVSQIALPAASPGPYPTVQWRPGFSLANIMNGSPDLRISPEGLLTCTATMQGLFVFAVKAEEYRKGIKIGETRRDFQLFVVDGCQPDQPPQITGKKLSDASFSYVDNMSVSFSNTVADGERCIVVRVADPDSNDPLHNNAQSVTIKVVPLNFRNKDISSILPSVTKADLTSISPTADFRICFPACPFINAPYQIGIIAYDDACSLPMTDTLKITVNTQPPANKNAYFLPQKKITAQLNEGSTGSWPFVAKDDDGDNLTVSLITDGFVLKDAGMNFKILNQQAGSANGELDWDAFCKNYEFTKKSDFTVKVLVDDQDKCKIIHFDTVAFHLKVLLPKINPKLRIYNESGTEDVTSSTINMNLGHVGFDVIGTDTDVIPIDTLNLSLLEASGDAPFSGYTFANVTGLHEVESKFNWDPDCSIFRDTTYTNNYELKFLVANNHCKTPKTDTAFVKLSIKEIKSTDKGFLPANVITTFPDHCNDFFAIEGFESEPDCRGQIRQIPLVPADNCMNRFEQVRIYDRWGKRVFESTDRKFRWYAATESAGVYYYIIYFTRYEYKSSLTVIH